MKLNKALVFGLLMTLFMFPIATGAEELTEEKKQRIDILLEKTGAVKIGEMFSGIFTKQAIAALKQSNPQVDPKAFTIIGEEISQVISEEVNDKNAINKLIYPIYDKHLTLAEINEIIKFYETPLGKKLLNAMPLITRESMQAGRTWGQSLGPVIQQRLKARLEKEGIRTK